jgi:hypothetical protein
MGDDSLEFNITNHLIEQELYYDDGTVESSITGGATDIELAVKFTTESAGELYTGRFMFSSIGQAGYVLEPVEIRVYSVGLDGLPATSLYVADEFTEVTVEDQWIEVDLSGEGIFSDLDFDDSGFFPWVQVYRHKRPWNWSRLDGHIYGHSFVYIDGYWLRLAILVFRELYDPCCCGS